MKITVIGTGYLGAVHAACMAHLDHDVLGVDLDRDKIEALAAGRAPFYEPGLSDVLAPHVASGRLRFTTSFTEAAEFGDVHFICVGTPQEPGSYRADLRCVRAAVDELAPHLNRKTLVVGKSTVPVGTAAVLARRLAELAPVRQGAELAWNPEFLREGHAVADTLSPDRLVLGVESAHADAILRSVYAPLLADGAPCITTDLATAELVKVSANAFLATKISFINAIADICDAAGADVVTLATALGHDDRIGHRFLSAGLGYGGGCLPKDVRAFLARACELGVGQSLRFLQEVDDVNTQRRTRVVELARELVGGSFLGRAVAVLGAAFKPGSDDVRDSPALDVAADIQRQGGRVRVHDPQALDNARAAFPGLDYTGKVDKACEQADIVLHLTDWEEYSDLDPAQLAKTARRPYLLDGRNTLALDRWRAAGWTAIAMGRAAGGATSHRVT